MIQFDKDGVTLVGYDANGNRFAHNYLEGTLYDNMLSTRSAQLAAARENTQAVANYNTVLGTIQASVDAGRPLTARSGWSTFCRRACLPDNCARTGFRWHRNLPASLRLCRIESSCLSPDYLGTIPGP